LLDGLVVLGKTSGHPELATVPVVIMGFSAGGQFSYSFACFCPARVLAFASNKGGIYLTPATDAAREIPGLFIAGANDLFQRRSAIATVFTENRRLGARWCMAIEPNRGHQTANANDLALPFFDAVIRRQGRSAAERAGIAFDLDHLRIIDPGMPPKTATTTFWFPDEAVLAVWNKFMTTPR
jgi:dienelactone hydrolase